MVGNETMFWEETRQTECVVGLNNVTTNRWRVCASVSWCRPAHSALAATTLHQCLWASVYVLVISLPLLQWLKGICQNATVHRGVWVQMQRKAFSYTWCFSIYDKTIMAKFNIGLLNKCVKWPHRFDYKTFSLLCKYAPIKQKIIKIYSVWFQNKSFMLQNKDRFKNI